MWWRFNEILGGGILLGVVAAVLAFFYLGLSIGRAPAVKATGVVTGYWSREGQTGSRWGIVVRLTDGRIAQLAQPARGDCVVGDRIDVWDQPTLLARRVLPRTQSCHNP